MYTHICSPELRISNSSRKLIQTVLTHSRANIYKLRRLLSSMLFELSDKILYRNGNSLINSYTEVFYNYGMPIEHIFKTNIDNSELFKNIYLLIFIDSGARYESMKLIMNIYDIIDTARFPRSNLFIIMSPQRFESVYARTLLFNITYNIFKSNFILSFSDDDLHIFLPSLYNFSMDFLNETKIIPLQFVYHPTSKRDVSIEDERVVLHTHFGRFLFPWKVFDLYPMTLDIGPKQREDLRFYIRAWINKAIVSDEVKPLIKYYYFGRTNNNYKLDDVIKPYIRDMMTIADIRIIYTQYRIKGDPRIQSINDLFKYHINVCSYKLKRVIQGDIDGIPLDPTKPSNNIYAYTTGLVLVSNATKINQIDTIDFDKTEYIPNIGEINLTFKPLGDEERICEKIPITPTVDTFRKLYKSEPLFHQMNCCMLRYITTAKNIFIGRLL